MILKKIGFGLAGMLFVLTPAVTEVPHNGMAGTAVTITAGTSVGITAIIALEGVTQARVTMHRAIRGPITHGTNITRDTFDIEARHATPQAITHLGITPSIRDTRAIAGIREIALP